MNGPLSDVHSGNGAGQKYLLITDVILDYLIVIVSIKAGGISMLGVREKVDTFASRLNVR